MKLIMEKLKQIKSCEWILLLILVFSGGFNEYISASLSVLLSVVIIFKIVKNKYLNLKLNLTSISITCILFFYAVSTFYALDRGEAFLGFIKHLPIFLYMILLFQDNESKERLFEIIPYYALLLGLLSSILMFVPVLSNYFAVSNRMAGFFQYPNTFALFLLVGELLLISKIDLKKSDVIISCLLLVLLILTGSRSVFVLAIISNIAIAIAKKEKKHIMTVGAILILIASIITVVSLLKDNTILDRFLNLSFKESTFVGRLLYTYDAFPLTWKYPFGLGYMGYYYIHPTIQTGVYSVMHVHNDFLQIILDIGWIPCLLLIAAIVKSFFSSKTPVKIILLTYTLHCFFDINLQFTAMFLMLLIFLDYNSGKEIIIKQKSIVTGLLFGSLGLVSTYFAIALLMSALGQYNISDTMYPYYTRNKVLLLINESNLNKQYKLANKIISQNEYVLVAYSAKTHYAFKNGDFENVIKYKNKIIEMFPLKSEEYEEYCYMLMHAATLYQQAGDNESAHFCQQELIKVCNKLKDLNNKVSILGKSIKDQPVDKVPEDIEQYLNKIITKS